MAKFPKTICAITLAFVSTVSVAASVVDITTAYGDGADTFLRGGFVIDQNTTLAYRESNYGLREIATLKFVPSGVGGGGQTIDYDNNFTGTALFRFDLSNVAGTITGAQLILGVRQTELGSSVGVTMANFGLLSEPSIIQGVASLTVPGTPNESTMVTVEFKSAALLTQINADTNDLITFAANGSPVISSGSRGVPFWSKENLSGGPIPMLQLTVEDVAPIPLPP